MPPGSIVGETRDSYVVNDGAGMVTVVPKSAVDPASYGYRSPTDTAATGPQASTPANFELQAPPPPPPEQLAPVGNLGVPANVDEQRNFLDAPVSADSQVAAPPQALQRGPAPVAAPRGQPMAPPMSQSQAYQQTGLVETAKGIDAQGRALATQATIEGEQADAEAKILGDQVDYVKAERLAQEEQRKVDQQRITELTAERQKAVDADENYKIDRNRRYASMGTGQKVGFWLSAALSGLGDALPHKSGPNMVLQMLESELSKDVDAQMDGRARLGKKAQRLGSDVEGAIAGSKSKAEQRAMLLATHFEDAKRQIDAMAKQYQSPMAQARAAGLMAELDQKKGALVSKAGDQAYQQEFGERQFAAQERHARAQEGIAYQNLQLQKDQLKDQRERADQALALEAAKLAQAGDKATADKVARQGIGGVPKEVKNEAGEVIGVENDVLRNNDGTPYIASTEKRAEELYQAKNITDEMVKIIDDVKKLGVGWKSSTAASKEYLQIKTKWANLRQRALSQSGFGVPSEKDWEVVDTMIGSEDPTKWRDQLPGIDTARQILLDKFNIALKNDKYNGPAYAPLDPSKLSSAQPDDIDRSAAFVGSDPSGGRMTWMTPSGQFTKGAMDERQVATAQGFPEMYAKADKAGRQKIFAALVDLQDNAANPNARAAANKALLQIQQDDMTRRKEPTSDVSTSSTARDSNTVYKPRAKK